MLVSKEWNQNLEKIEGLDFSSILKNNTIRSTMYQSDASIFVKEASYLFEKFPDRLLKISRQSKESEIGEDLFETNIGVFCPNDVHHLYHICLFVENTKISEKKKIFEWGGGYGNFSKIFYLSFPELIEEYVIFDLPQMSKIQRSYLDLKGLSNVKTENNIENISDLSSSCNLFVATWSLSECPIALIDKIERLGFLNSSFLIALHQCGPHIPFFEESTYLLENVKKRDSIVVKNEIIPGINYYIFKSYEELSNVRK